MKTLIGVLISVLAVAAQSELEIDWSKVKPISELPEFKAARENQAQVYKSSENRRVFGGKPATKFEFPYQVGILFSPSDAKTTTEKILGGGSIISSTRVLTAAHNVQGVLSALVILGAMNIFVFEPTQVRINVPKSGLVSHPNFNLKKLLNDIAIIKLPSAVTFNNAISPIALPEAKNDYVGFTGVISGWGEFDKTKKQSQILRYANFKVVTNLECSEVYSDIIDSTICAKGAKDVSGCDGDSGGPLAVMVNGKRILVGVISFVSECNPQFPTGCARVSSFIPWIRSNM